jgi:Tfp pilus assembly protein PilX
MKRQRSKNKKGIALLVVLFIVMVVTVLSLGFLSKSDVELACGENMILRTQMDYLAESGLEHARGLIVNDGNCPDVLTTQLEEGDDYYCFEVSGPVLADPCDPNERSYSITSTAYRDKAGRRIGESILKGELYIDPNQAYWTSIGR